MVKKSLLKNTFREIKHTKARFFSIMLIIGLGVGFLSGVKSTSPSMLDMAEKYYNDTNLMDYRLISPLGFDKNDINEITKNKNITSVMPSYFSDVTIDMNGSSAPIRVFSLPEKYNDYSELNELTLIDGRFPAKDNETVIDGDGLKNYKIGDYITIDKEVDGKDTLKSFTRLKYKVVGIVRTPQYISFERDTTTVGDGKLRGFIYINSNSFKIKRYTEIYLKTKYSDDLSPFDEKYDNNIDKFSDTLDSIGSKRVNAFVTNKQDKLNKKYEQYNKKKTESKKKISDAKKEINNSEKELNKTIADSESKITSAETEYNNGLSEYYSKEQEYQTKISNAETALSDAESQILTAETEYNKNVNDFNTKITDAENKLSKAKKEYETNFNQFYDVTKPEAENQIQTLRTASENIASAKQGIEQAFSFGMYDTCADTLANVNAMLAASGQNTLPEYTAEQISDKTVFDSIIADLSNIISDFNNKADTAVSSLTDGKNALKSAKSQITTSENELKTQKSEGKAKLSKAKKELDESKGKIEYSKTELENQKQSGRTELDNAYSKLNSAKTEIDSSKTQLENKKKSAENKLHKASTKISDSEKKANKELKKAKSKLDDAQKQINEYKGKKWYINTRIDNPGYSSFSDNAQRVDNVATIFPIFFLLVAILVCVTTMTRLVDEKRTETGTLKALGYSNKDIISKYLIYSSLSGITGCILGIVIFVPILPKVIFNAYKIMYNMRDIEIVPDWNSMILGVIVALLCTILVAVFTCKKSLKENSASLMRPKSPKPGTRILLEKIKPLWSRIGFTSKVTARNIFRYKPRFFMTVLGVAGCTALILAAFYLHDSITNLVDIQYSDIYSYDAVVLNKNDGAAKELSELTDYISKDKRISVHMLYNNESVIAKHKNNRVDSSLYLFVPESEKKLEKMIALRDRTTNKKIQLNNKGVVITEKLSKLLNINKGDKISVKLNNSEHKFLVTGITEHYVFNYIYMSPELYEKSFDSKIKYNMTMLKIPEISDKQEQLIGKDFLKNKNITAISFNSQGINNFRKTVKSLDMVVMVMIICAGLLAFVVLYNLTNINIAERQREIATLKVLGFYNKETSAYIYRENIVLTIFGIIFGLILGIFLGYFIIVTVEIESVMFGRTISLLSFVFATILTAIFSLFVNFIMHFKMKKIDMIESLKSIE